MRIDNRKKDQLRRVKVTRNYTKCRGICLYRGWRYKGFM